MHGGLEIELACEETWGTGERGTAVASMVRQVGVGPSSGHAMHEEITREGDLGVLEQWNVSW